jgi:hypothetical protein
MTTSAEPFDFSLPAAGKGSPTANGVRTENAPIHNLPPLLGDILAASLTRVDRRCSGIEKPIPLPWPILADHFGGGLWPGLHILNAGTGAGKTQWALQVGSHAAKQRIPVLYVGLELGELDLALRVIGEAAHVPWSPLWTGTAGPAYVAKAHEAAATLQDLPFHYEVARPHGLPASVLRVTVEGFRALYPETDGPGSRPLLLIVDFLQLIGDEPGDEKEMRVRIGRASYALRDFANRLGLAVLCISSIARDRYKLCNELQGVGELTWETDANGWPIDRRILNTDAIVGAGKESGDIEYSADSVSILAKVPGTWAGTGCDVIFATAKGRATGARWSPLHFTGFAYRECEDRGGRMVETWKQAGEKRERAKAEKKAAKEEARAAAIAKDAEALRAYVATHPGCSVREARVQAVGDSGRRWAPAVAKLDGELVESIDGRTHRLTLSTSTTVDVDTPPHTPPPSTSTVDGPGGPTMVGMDSVDRPRLSTVVHGTNAPRRQRRPKTSAPTSAEPPTEAPSKSDDSGAGKNLARARDKGSPTAKEDR